MGFGDRGPGVIHEHLLAGSMLLARSLPGRASLTTPPVEVAEAAVAIAVGVCSRHGPPARPTAGSGPCASATLGGSASSPALDVSPNGEGWPLLESSVRSICWSFQFSGAGHFTPAACAVDKYSWTVLCEMEQLRSDLVLAQSGEWSRRTSIPTCASSASSVARPRESPLTGGGLIATAALRAIPIQCRSQHSELQPNKLIGFSSRTH